MRSYKNGQIIGSFEIIERMAHTLGSNGAQRGRYRVRCLKCGDVVKLDSKQLQRRSDCGCTIKVPLRRGDASPNECWMSDGEIYRSWKAMKNHREGINVLAQLNDVPLSVIEDIIDRESKKEEE